LVSGVSQQDEKGMPLEDQREIEVICAQATEDLRPVVSVEQAIKKLLAEKYLKKELMKWLYSTGKSYISSIYQKS